MSDDQKIIYKKATYYLGKREYSRKELKSKLLNKYPESTEIDFVLETVTNLDYLNEKRYCRASISRYLKKGHSPEKIKILLRNENIQVCPSLIQEVSDELGINSNQMIIKLIEKKLRTFDWTTDLSKIQKKKNSVMSFLLSKGYEYNDIVAEVTKAFEKRNN